jgi:hypothetical protein
MCYPCVPALWLKPLALETTPSKVTLLIWSCYDTLVSQKQGGLGSPSSVIPFPIQSRSKQVGGDAWQREGAGVS